MRRASHRMRRGSTHWIVVAVLVVSALVVVTAFVLRSSVTKSEATTSPRAAAHHKTPSPSPTDSDTAPRPVAEQPSPPTFPQSTSVLVIGDSLAVGIAEQVTTAMPDRQIVVEAAEGRNTATSVALVTGHAAYTPSIWVVSLGTNDNADEFKDNAEALMGLAGDDRCVLWYDVYRPEYDTEINAILGDIQATHSNVQLLAWSESALAHPEWFSVDQIHPSADGYLQRSELASDAVTQTCTEHTEASAVS